MVVRLPNGPLISQADQHIELFIPTGNGQVDLNRQDYANALMPVTPGLEFTDGCDRQLCANFNPTQPSSDCLNSCKNLFIPRLAGNHEALSHRIMNAITN